MRSVRSELVIRLDEEGSRFVFLLRHKDLGDGSANGEPAFSVEIPFQELHLRGAYGAEKLVGESVLGFFGTLTAGRLALPRHYLDNA